MNKVLEMTATGLDAHYETMMPLMHRSCNDGMIQLSPHSSYAVLEVVEICHTFCTPFIAMPYVPQT